MAPSPPSRPFWSEVRAQATAGSLVVAITAIFGGVVYLIHTVPAKLDEVLDNQLQYKGRIETLEKQTTNNTERIIRLEARP